MQNTFENYITYKGNMMAQSAVLAASRKSGSKIAPLFIHGSTGLGKTHLVNAAFTKLMDCNEDLSIKVTTGERFHNELVYALCNRKYVEFVEGCKSMDVFIMDDIHLLTSMEAQSTFHDILDVLLTNGKLVIMTSNVPPMYLANFDKGLLSKVSSGYVVEVEAPCFETRVCIIKEEMDHLLSSRLLNVEAAELEKIYALIASCEDSDIGKMKKMVNRILSFASLLNENIDFEFSKKILMAAKK